MSWLSSLFGSGKKDTGEQAYTANTYDPLQSLKTSVATPLSSFLTGQVGQGIGQLPTDPNYTNRYNEFLSVNPEQYFKTNISDPAYAQFTKYAKPLIDEGYAGSLRGSGHYGAQEAGYVGLGEQLGNTAAQFIPQFAQSQLQAGQSEFSRQYQNWFNSLPQTNPALAQAINFINAGKEASTASGNYPAQNSFLSQLGATGIAQQLGSIGGPSFGSNGQPQTTGFSDVLKNPQTWISLASLLAAA